MQRLEVVLYRFNLFSMNNEPLKEELSANELLQAFQAHLPHFLEQSGATIEGGNEIWLEYAREYHKYLVKSLQSLQVCSCTWLYARTTCEKFRIMWFLWL